MKDLIKNNWLVTVVAAAVVAIVFLCLRAGMDSTATLALVGGLAFVVGKLFHVMPPPGAAAVLLALSLPLASGCAALRTLNDVRKEACDLLGEQQKQAVQADADRAGIGFAEALAIWKMTCLIRMRQAEDQTAIAGSSAIRTHDTPAR